MSTNRRARLALLATAMVGAGFGAAPAAAQSATAPSAFFNCRASAVYASLTGNDRVEPVVANGNPNTGEGRSPDFALCADGNVGAGSVATQLAIPTDVLSARTASAITSVDPDNAYPVDQKVGSSASVEDLRLPLGSGSVVLGVAAANSAATASCVAGAPDLQGASQLTGLTLGGTPLTLDELITALTEALAPLGPIVEITPNEQVRDGNSLTVRALHVKVFRDAGSSPLLDVVVAESRVVAPEGVCVRPSGGGTAGAGDTSIRPCPAGAELDAGRGVCVIRGEGANGADITIGRPFQGPSGGTVDSLRDARRRFPNSPCVKGEGLGYVIVGTNGADRITGTNGSDRMILRGGNDRASGGRGKDCMDGGSGRDVLSGSTDSDRLYGMAGNDALTGGSHTDRLSGGSGNDTINAGYGSDRVFGGPGRDFINVATAGRKATVNCGDGRDKVRFNNEEKRTVQRSCEVRYEFSDRPRR